MKSMKRVAPHESLGVLCLSGKRPIAHLFFGTHLAYFYYQDL
jgi:hypothetical protein